MFGKKNYKIIFHVTASLIFLSLPIIFSPDFDTSLDMFLISPFQKSFITYILLLAFFYVNYYVLIPLYFFNKRYIFYVALTILAFFIIIYVPQLIIGFPKPPFDPSSVGEINRSMNPYPPPHPPSHRLRFFGFLNFGPPVVQFLLIFILSLMLKMNERLKRTEREKTLAELSYLKAQINPHFLFNSLNSIYALALEKSDLTADAIIKLSGIMRYIISEANHDVVLLQKEIDYLNDYINLQKFRLENTVNLTFNTQGDFSNHFIAPLLLIPFIENAFKYGVNPEEKSEIIVEIALDNGIFTLKTYNKKVKHQDDNDTTNKLGLRNTRQRLLTLYPAKHKLEIKEDNTAYTVKLNIDLS